MQYVPRFFRKISAAAAAVFLFFGLAVLVSPGLVPAASAQVSGIGTVAISGEPGVGHELTGTLVDWTDSESMDITYQWKSTEGGGAPLLNIEGATATSYTPTEADLGLYLFLTVTADGNSVDSDLVGPILHLPLLGEADGSGYYSIDSCEKLHMISYGLDGKYKLTADIDCAAADPRNENFDPNGPWSDRGGFHPIGSRKDPFTGELLGNVHSISGLFIDRGDDDAVALFAAITEPGSVSDLGLVDASISGNDYTAALVGFLTNGTVTRVSSSGEIHGDNDVGGLVGHHEGIRDERPATVIDSWSSADVYGGYSVGGLVGYNFMDMRITGSHAAGHVYGYESVGGLVGNNDGGSILRSYATGDVDSSSEDEPCCGDTGGAGGLVGSNIDEGRVEDSYATGHVNGAGYRIGGLVGQNGGTIVRSYASGEVDGYDRVGGLVGANGGTISNSYARGQVDGVYDVGGLAGRSGGTIEYSYSTGHVFGDDSTPGGLVGDWQCCSSINSSFWDDETSGTDWSDGGMSRSTSEMKDETNFTDYGWDFQGIWAIDGSEEPVNDGYPYLLTFTPPPFPDDDADGYYDISDCEQLQQLNRHLSWKFELVGDISCLATDPDSRGFDPEGPWGDGYGFQPIGDTVNWFTGELAGNGHVIDDLYIDRDQDYVGLFAVIGTSSAVSDFGLERVRISGNNDVGALAGFLGGTATGVHSTGQVNGSYDVGGLVGMHDDPYGIGSSSPLLFTWNGAKYEYVADVGRGLPRNTTGDDPVPVDNGSLVPKDGKYSVQVGAEYNEINYYDELALVTFDHAPGYQIATSPLRQDRDNYFTVATSPSHPLLSCTDKYGHDCLDDLRSFDDKWSYKDETGVNYWTMDFGDLSGAKRIQLVLRGATDWSLSGSFDRFIQVKDAQGNWVNAYDQSQISTLNGSPRNEVVDLTGKFVPGNYEVRMGFNLARINYVAIDTSDPVPYTMNVLHPAAAELDFRGFTAADRTYFWDHDYDVVSDKPAEPFAPQTGNFTRYGDVAPLLAATDDQFVIMHYGDHMDVSFDYVAPPAGTERNFAVYNWVTYKHASKETGQTVEPLPFRGMSRYPYEAPEAYPLTPENAAYLATWNTRQLGGLVAGSGSTIIDSWSAASVTGYEYIGGLLGYNNNKLVTGSHAGGTVSGSYDVGGLVGQNYNGTIEDSYAIGDVHGTQERTGGLVGQNSYGHINRSYATGAVDGNSRAGGLVGANGGYIYDAYARGAVTGNDNVGGLCGRSGRTIYRSYSTGAVSGGEGSGGLVGCQGSGYGSCGVGGDTNYSFWNYETSGLEESASGTGLSTDEMRTQTTFTDVGWDFDEVWIKDDIRNFGFPYLRAIPAADEPVSSGRSEVGPSAAVSSPNGGETLFSGNGYQIFWGVQGTGVTGSRVSYSTNGGSSWTVIKDDLSGGYLDWIAPNVSTSIALIRVEALGSGGVVLASDTSDANFTIAGAAPAGGGGGGGGTTPPVISPPSGEQGGSGSNVGDGGAPGSGNNPDTEGAGSSASGPDSLGRQGANQQLPPGYTVDALVKLPSDHDPLTTDDSTIYYIGLDAKRHPFPTRDMYHTWYAGFSSVREIDAATLAVIPLGEPILVRPGTKWIKLQTDPKTYYVAPGYRLRWIQDEAAAVALWGPDWNRNILDVSDALFTNFTVGSPITAAGLATGWPSGSLVQDTAGQRWYVTMTERRLISNEAAFTANLFQTAFVRVHPSQIGWQKPVGAPIVAREDALTSLLH